MNRTPLNRRKIWAVCLASLASIAFACDDDSNVEPTEKIEFNDVALFGANMRPAVTSIGVGVMDVVYNDATNTLDYSITWRLGNPADNTVGLHFHGPADANSNAPPVIVISNLKPYALSSHQKAGYSFETNQKSLRLGLSETIVNTTRALTQAEENDLKAGLWYVSIKSTSYPEGELRGNLVRFR